MDLTAPILSKKTAVFNLDGSATVKTYALTIAENLINSRLRKTVPIAQNEIRTDPTEGFSPLANTAAPVDFGLQLFENRNTIARFLNKLRIEKPEYAQLIELRFLEEMSYKDIAAKRLKDNEKHFTSEESCKSHTSRALGKLVEIARSEGLFSK